MGEPQTTNPPTDGLLVCRRSCVRSHWMTSGRLPSCTQPGMTCGVKKCKALVQAMHRARQAEARAVSRGARRRRPGWRGVRGQHAADYAPLAPSCHALPSKLHLQGSTSVASDMVGIHSLDLLANCLGLLPLADR